MALLALDFPTASFPPSAALDADCDTTVETVAGSGVTVHAIDIDNTLNTSTHDVWLHMFNTTGSVTVGTTAPDSSLPCRGGERITYSSVDGWAFATGLKVCCKTAGGTAGTTAPTSDVKVRILYA